MKLKYDCPYFFWILEDSGRIVSPTFDDEFDAYVWQKTIYSYMAKGLKASAAGWVRVPSEDKTVEIEE